MVSLLDASVTVPLILVCWANNEELKAIMSRMMIPTILIMN
jgi:hypothetical protein